MEVSLTKARWDGKKAAIPWEPTNTHSGLPFQCPDNSGSDTSSCLSSKNTLRFPSMRVSDLPTNREVRLPDPMQNDEESKLLSFKMEVLECVKNYISQNCSEGGKQETN